MTATDFAARVRNGETVIGYWVVTDNPVGTERLARAGYDYVALDAQHGLIGYQGMLTGLRIDHPDGLSDPQGDFDQLQARYAGMAEVSARGRGRV